jgi:CRP/FNR family cyclic AMP-dependent transcriptional regulator
MYFKQKDIFWGMSKEFAKQIMKISVTESHHEGELLFGEGDPANSFYVLLKGCVKLSLGEAFGWSSLIGRENYTASAQFMTPTKLLKFDREKLRKVLEKDTANSLILFKRLAEILGNRLLLSYRIIASASRAEISPSYGTGQVMALMLAELEKS